MIAVKKGGGSLPLESKAELLRSTAAIIPKMADF